MAQFVNADQPVNPASTMKLVTTYAALELLGPNYQWQTDLYGTGPISNGELQGDLIFRSSGDPKLTMERLWLMLRDLRAAGVREVRGDLVLQPADLDRKSTRMNSSHVRISYAVSCLKKKG